MTEKDTKVVVKRLANDEGYYASVFKKSEKIVAVISYILSHTDKSQKDNTHLLRIEEKTIAVHESVMDSLALRSEESEAALLSFQYELMSLESTLRVAQAAGVIAADILQLLLEQLDTVQRYINNHYTKQAGYSIDIAQSATQLATPTTATASSAAAKKPLQRRKKVQIPAGDISTDAYLVYSQMTDRAERIKTVLEAKPQATIKDVAEVITDVSEKTIQRELNSLIEKGQVIREGERRWSKYSIQK